MKKLYIILLALIINCDSSSTEIKIEQNIVEQMPSSNSVEEVPFEFDIENLYQKWYAKKILVNGIQDNDEFPVNNDLLILNKDFTFSTTDNTYNYTEEGTYRIENPNLLTLTTEDWTDEFAIISLTADEFITELKMNGMIMLIYYSNQE